MSKTIKSRKKPIGYYFQGDFYRCNNATDTFVSIFEMLNVFYAEFHTSFDKSRYNSKTGRRNLISRDRCSLYISCPRLIEQSREMTSGYWIGTNYSTERMLSSIMDACELLDELEHSIDLRVTLEEQDIPIKEYTCTEQTRIFVNEADEEVSPYNASYDNIYYCAYCHCVSFLRIPENTSPHFYHSHKPSKYCLQYVGGKDGNFEGEVVDHGIDYEKRRRETISRLIENGNEAWLQENRNESWLLGRLDPLTEGNAESQDEEKKQEIKIPIENESSLETEKKEITILKTIKSKPTIYNGFKTTVQPDGESVEIYAYIGTEQVVCIPSEIVGLRVTSIGLFAFQRKRLTSITFPGCMTSISPGAFRKNELTSIIIPNNVTVIRSQAFQYNNLMSINIPHNVICIEDLAFADNWLDTIDIPNSIASIGNYAFANNQLNTINISNSVTSIGNGAFHNNKLTSVVIPDNVASIGSDAFGYNRLTSIIIPKSVTFIGSFAFRHNQLTSVEIPNSVTYIGRNAFCENELKKITIGENVVFGFLAFGNGFIEFYKKQGRKTGTYIFDDDHWNI